MISAQIKLDYKETDCSDSGIPVIIAAAGLSSRMNGIKKQLISLLGIPVLVRTMLCFERSPFISGIIVAAREEDIPEIQLLADKYMITKLTDIVTGGDCRQQSVANAFSRLRPTDKNVLIHDGARPLVSGKIISDVVTSLEKYEAVGCGVRVKDTVKRVGKDGTVLETLNRDELVLIQTPQGVRAAAYRKAVESAGDICRFTDDLSIMEAAGYAVHIVCGDSKNIKITTPEDIFLAESYITGVDAQ